MFASLFEDLREPGTDLSSDPFPIDHGTYPEHIVFHTAVDLECDRRADARVEEVGRDDAEAARVSLGRVRRGPGAARGRGRACASDGEAVDSEPEDREPLARSCARRGNRVVVGEPLELGEEGDAVDGHKDVLKP